MWNHFKTMLMRSCVFILLLILIYSCQNNNNTKQSVRIGDFSFSSQNITQNQTFEVEYHGDEELGLSFMHQINHNYAYPVDVIFDDKIAKINIPDSISIVSFFFTKGNRRDINDGKGYIFYVVNQKGEMTPETKALEQTYLITNGSYNDIEGGNVEIAFKEVDKLMISNPDLSEHWYRNHLNLASKADKNKLKEIIQMYVNPIVSKVSLGLSDYKKLNSIYQSAGLDHKSDSISSIIITKFPDSESAQRALIDSYYDLETLESRQAFFDENEMEKLTVPNMSFVYTDLASKYFYNGDLDNFYKYLNNIERIQNKSSLLNNIAWDEAKKENNLGLSAELSQQAVDIIRNEQKQMLNKPQYFSKGQYEQRLDYDYKMYQDTYAYIQYKLGNLDKALQIQEQIIGKGLNVEYNERYIDYLIENKDYQKVFNQSKSFIANGNSSSSIKENFKIAFLNIYPKQDYIDTLYSIQQLAKVKLMKNIKKDMIDKPAPNFVAKNLDGEKVSLDELKGKTLVLDFWATWCGPCIESFPGMQRAVEKYKSNDAVEFLFIDTFERGENRQQDVQNFIDKNNYSFHVLMDPFDSDKNVHTIATDYNVSGIPTKVIIKDGRIRFRDVGYGGSHDKLVEKLDIMIELLNSNLTIDYTVTIP